MPAFTARARIIEFVLIGLALIMLAVFVFYLVAGWDDDLFRGRALVRTIKLLVPVCVLIALPRIRASLFRFLGEGSGGADDARTIVILWVFIVAACITGMAVIGYDFRTMLSY